MTNKLSGDALATLEKNKSFKIQHIPFSKKWKSWLYVGPVLILFMSLFSMIYLLKINMLSSWYVIPYIVVFVVATLWFRAVRTFIYKEMIESPDFFLTAIAKPVLTDEFKVYALFSVGVNRQNQKYIEHQAANVSSSYADLITQMKPNEALPLLDECKNGEDCLYLCCFRKFIVKNKNASWGETDSFPILLIDKKAAKCISI